jgi:hypothetical protein
MSKPTPRLSRAQRVTPEDIRLRSDYLDFYDHHFAGGLDGDRPVWPRYAAARERDRALDHLLLRCAGLETPEGQPLGGWPGETIVVAYTDPHAHRGDGKRMGTVDELLAGGVSATTYSVMWVGGRYSRGRSLRLLSCGRSHYWLDYRQRDPGEWRSNVGDVEIVFGMPGRIEERAYQAAARLQRALKEPLTAVDFVDAGEGRWVAVDLNTAPGIRGTPVEDEPRAARDVAESIAARWGELCL